MDSLIKIGVNITFNEPHSHAQSSYDLIKYEAKITNIEVSSVFKETSNIKDVNQK